jgi:glycopeptide antibiotics resistance protein
MIHKIAPDKWRHFIAGIIMGVIVQAFFWWLWPDQLKLITFLTFIIVLSVSYGFELFSKITGKGRYDFMDAVASVIGGVLGMGLIFIVVFFF